MARRRSLQFELPFVRGTIEPFAQAHIALGGQTVSYLVRRSDRRRSISLTIDERGLRVGAPHRASAQEIDAVLRRHATWVLRKLAEWHERRAAPPRWVNGETLMYRGAPLALTLVPGRSEPLHVGEQLLVGAENELPRAVGAWFRREALVCFEARVAHFRAALDVPAPAVRLSNARTRWGSCHAAGRIRFNWRMIQFPLRLIDYVVVHELAHLREMNHSIRFWRVVAGLLPDYAVRRREIRLEGDRYLKL